MPTPFAISPAETDMRRHLVLRARVFGALEGLSVLGVPVGDLVEETLDVDCAAGVLRDPRPLSRAETALRRGALRFRRLLERLRGDGRAWPAPLAPGRVVIDVASTGHNCRRIWEPVARALGSDDVVLAVPARAPAADRVPGLEWIAPARLPVDFAAWRAWVSDGQGEWVRRARSLTDVGITERGAHHLAWVIALQGLRVFQAFALVDFYRPRAVLALADRGASGSALVGAARVRGLPTLTIAHCPVGRTFGQTFLPLSADRLLVWGEYQRGVFAEMGVPADRLAVVGFPGAEEARGTQRADAGAGGRRALVVTGPMRDRWRRAWAGEVAGAARLSSGSSFVVRVHPSESPGFYRPIFAGLANVAVVDNRAQSLEEALAEADTVVVHGSSVGLDALVARRDLVVLDCLPFTLGTMREVVEAGAATRVSSGAELAEALAAAGTTQARAEIRRRARAFVDGFFAASGAEATRRVVAEIQRAAPPRP